jgi:photosystem II stability/assembly factor-like uncharacterized protein
MNTGVVCGASGWVGKTSNGGLSWDSAASATTSTLYGVHFINSTTGFACGTTGVVIKSTDAGATWAVLATGVTTSLYNIYPFDVNNIFVCTSSNNVLITTNGGVNWTTYATGGATLYDINFIDVNTGFVCGSSGGFRYSTNGGVNWTASTMPVTSTMYEMAITSTQVQPFDEGFEGTTFPPTGWRAVNVIGSVVWVRSTSQYHSGTASAFINYDCGASGGLDWLITPQRAIYTGDSLTFWLRTQDWGYIPDSLAVRVSTTDTALASFTNRILYIADGNGYPPASTWQKYAVSLNSFAGQNIYIAFKHGDNCGDGIYIDDVHIGGTGSVTIPVVYVAGDASNLYVTNNYGANWTALPYNDPLQLWTSTYYSMDINTTNIVVAGASGLLLKSSNSGTNWNYIHTWLSPGTKYDVWAQYNDKKVIVTGGPGISGTTFDQVLVSTNGGTTWTTGAINSWATFYGLHMIDANTGWMVGSYGAVRKTTNGGLNWDSVTTVIPNTVTLRKVKFLNANTGWIFAMTTNAGNTIWKTTDAGVTWGTQSTGTVDGRIYSAKVIDANIIYAGNYVPKLIKSTDGGNNWVSCDNTPMGSGYIYDLEFFDANTGIMTGSAGARLCRTTNGGTSFDTIPTPTTSALYTSRWIDVQHGWIFGATGIAARTLNGGTSWDFYNTSGSTPYGSYMKYLDSVFVVGASGYVHKLNRNYTGIATWENRIPSAYYLSQNYPNPFNPTTTIKFGLPKSGSVSLKVYDIVGRLVATIFNNTPLNAGTVVYKFDGKDFASGVYFYTLFVDGSKVDTKKMILVK